MIRWNSFHHASSSVTTASRVVDRAVSCGVVAGVRTDQ
jgi:hypothetical protein